MTEKSDSVQKSVAKFPAGVEKKKYDLVEKSVEKFSSYSNMFDSIDVRH